MKKLIRIILILNLLLLEISCRSSKNLPQENIPENSQSINQDSSEQMDIWTKYSYSERRGKILYDVYCVKCHGANGEGDGFNSYNLDPRPHSLADSAYVSMLSDGTLEQFISFGGRGVNRSVLMPAYNYTLSKEEISYLVKFIRTF